MDRLTQATNGLSAGNIIKPPRPATDIDAVEDALSTARAVASRVIALADHLLGCTPESGACSTSDGTADGLFPRLAQSASATRYRLADAMTALDRIQSAAT